MIEYLVKGRLYGKPFARVHNDFNWAMMDYKMIKAAKIYQLTNGKKRRMQVSI